MLCTRSVNHQPLRSGFLIALFCFAFGVGRAAHGQTDPASDGIAPPDGPKDFRFSVGWVSTVGSYTYVPERWGELHITLVNARDVPRELTCATSFDLDQTLQYARQVWLPARSKLQITHPILIPKCDPEKGRNLPLHSLILDGTSRDNVLVKDQTGKLLHDGTLLVTHSPRNTAIVGSLELDEVENPPKEVSDLVVACRVGQQLNNRVTRLYDSFLPCSETALNCYDHIVLADNRICDDLAAMSALRHWLNAGGRLWIMLDRVDASMLEKLLGDDFSGHVVDRVGLTTVRVDRQPNLFDKGLPGEEVIFEVPVEMARMIPGNLEVTHVVNGWPAAMTKTCGDGMVLITTLGPQAWMKRQSTGNADPLMKADFVPSSPMNDIIAGFLAQRQPELLPRESVQLQAQEYVGYSIPSWGVVVGTLIGFSISLVVLGSILLRTGRLEHMGWISSGVGVVVSVALLLIGRSFQQAVPGTVASIQIAQAEAGTDDVRTDGLLTVYQPDGSDSEIKTDHGGRMFPDMTGLESATRRMVTTDFDAWHWENLAQPPGLRATTFVKSETVTERMEAYATLDANGLVGHYAGRLPIGSDALIATHDGRIGVKLQSDGSFAAPAESVFGKDQYLDASLLGDEQNRRRRTYEKLLSNPKRRNYPDRPLLMFWSDQWEHGFQFSSNLKNQTATLVTIPLTIERPVTGTEYVIPSPLLVYRTRHKPDGTPSSVMWNFGRKEWQERSTPGENWLSFQLPHNLLPLTVSRARLEISVTGPVGKLEVMGLNEDKVVSLKTFVDPVGSLSIDITDPAVLSVNESGRLSLGILAGDADRPELTHVESTVGTNAGKSSASSKPNKSESDFRKVQSDAKTNYWRIESLTLQLWAKSTEPTAKD